MIGFGIAVLLALYVIGIGMMVVGNFFDNDAVVDAGFGVSMFACALALVGVFVIIAMTAISSGGGR